MLTIGVQTIIVILVTFNGVNLPITNQNLHDEFFGTTTYSVDGYVREASYGQASTTGTVVGPYTIPQPQNCGDSSLLNNAIAAAIADGNNINNYTRVFVAFPDNLGCGWAGYTPVGQYYNTPNPSFTTPSGTFNATLSYLSADYMTVSSPYVPDYYRATAIASHELGHQFGLLHSGTISAGNSQPLGSISSPGTEVDMGDYWAIMGETVTAHYTAPQKAETLSWLASGNYAVVQGSGTYTLQPLETSPTGLTALKVLRGTGNSEWLWVEYRQPVGYDSLLGSQPFSGALIHYEDQNTTPGHTYLVNFNPSGGTWNSPALAAGQSWTDPYSNLALAVTSANPTGMTINVTYGAPPPPPPPTLTVAVTVSPTNYSLKKNSAVPIVAPVTYGNPVAGATVVLTLVAPNGQATAQTLTTGQNGTANWSYKLGRKSQTGTYSTNATASYTPPGGTQQISSSNTATFTVQ